MSAPARKRLTRDFKRLMQDPPAGISGAPQGTFKLTLQFTEEYPNKPPTVRFISRMFHPNIVAV